MLELAEAVQDNDAVTSESDSAESDMEEDSASEEEGMRTYGSRVGRTQCALEEESPVREVKQTKLDNNQAIISGEEATPIPSVSTPYTAKALQLSRDLPDQMERTIFLATFDRGSANMDENTINYSKVALLIDSSEKMECSPYRSPFTPSKRRQSGKYVYIPLETLSGEESEVKCSGRDTAVVKDTREPRHCEDFLKEYKTCSIVSFRLIKRPIPIAAPRETRRIVERWSGLISWTGCAKENKKAVSHAPSVISGVALCFGSDSSYYLPLPCPLPQLPLRSTAESSIESALQDLTLVSDAQESSYMERLPSSCKVLICRFVGFERSFSKCPHLVERLLARNPRDISPNPLLSVSFSWACVARKALMQEWLKGRCLEWKLFSNLMSDSSLTKVSCDMIEQLAALRERDVISAGHMRDPLIGSKLLPPSSAIPTDFPTQLSWGRLSATEASLRKACSDAFHALCLIRRVETALRSAGTFDIYRNIEMPLLLPIADMHFIGMPADWTYFGRITQYMSERHKEINTIFEKLSISCSPPEIHKLRARLKRELEAHLDKRKHHEQSNIAVAGGNQKLTSAELARLVDAHPLSQLQAEGRAVESMLTSLRGILRHKLLYPADLRGRVRAHYNTLGTETGLSPFK